MFGIKEREKIPCKTCGKPTSMLGTKLCDPCWEVQTRLSGYLNNEKAIQFVLKALNKAQPEPQHGREPKPLAQYLGEYIEQEIFENSYAKPKIWSISAWQRLFKQALEAYESTENVVIQIIKKKAR